MLSITMLESRWRLFGKILRRDVDIPGNKSMKAYFVPKDDKFLGRQITILPTADNKDLCRMPASEPKLKTKNKAEEIAMPVIPRF